MEQRVADLLDKMTLEEKLDYIGGLNDFYIRPVERLGLPAIKMSDGPVGVRNYGPTTAYPAGIALAATWDTKLAGEYGKAIGRDGRARGVHIWLAPGMNIYRAPLCGRNFEYLGEDPFLASSMAVPLVRGVQGEGVLATVKHFACNNQEYDRHKISSEIDERTLREIYLPAFKAAVTAGGAACVMDAYNPVNGTYCTANSFLNTEFLKKECGFDGIIMSDWGAVHDAIGAANGGLDLEMPSGAFMNSKNILSAIREGKVSQSTIDDKVRRILRIIARSGFLDRPQKIDSIPPDDPSSARIALEIAREGIVLLKNRNKRLPLDASQIKSIAVIGPNANPGVPAGGGSSFTTPFHSMSVLDAIRQRANGTINVIHVPWGTKQDITTLTRTAVYEHISPDGKTEAGLIAEYFANTTLSGKPVTKQVDEHIDFDWKNGSPNGLPADNFSIRWTGRIRPAQSASHVLAAHTDDGVRVWLDGKKVLDQWNDHAARTDQVVIRLKAGKSCELKVEYYERQGDASAKFGWAPAPDADMLTAVPAARKADVAVVCVGFNSELEGEGFDRPFELPGGQDDLIRQIASVNPRTIVVLNSGGAVDMRQWIGRVPAIIQAWYPGQEGGKALAEILFGDVNPSGKLPATFEKRWQDNPSFPYYHTKDGKTTRYTEGIFMGYRGYDAKGVNPQFCFGHGLSYATFTYHDLAITPTQIQSGGKVNVSFQVTNSGDRAGAETAQVYVRDVRCHVPRPVKELKAFHKTWLKPDESETVTLELDKNALSFFDPDAKQWVVEPGKFDVLVGSSSRDIRLSGSFEAK
ncbi:MAG: glycoside hydrolase family 3 C-terminal domain-containing protein [bacterium]|nr:glycoside hydrolase family 3 C-terminal domain-containing protein [Candidatus Sumerlaeota bacterium]